ncbi:MAG: hypothetical protein ACFC03_03285 [Candidatus Malihini olakiniferum]
MKNFSNITNAVPVDPTHILKLSVDNGNNLKETLTLPIGLFTCITGVFLVQVTRC